METVAILVWKMDLKKIFDLSCFPVAADFVSTLKVVWMKDENSAHAHC